HTDAGANVVRAYPVEKDGAGYQANLVNIMEGDKDQWFRPSDICVAPDGSIMVADWYDPGVGGHQAGDLDRGRIFRIAAHDSPYGQPALNINTLDGATEALLNPNLSIRYQAWKNLRAMGKDAEGALSEVFEENKNPRFQARAFWLLAKIEGLEGKYIQMAINHAHPDLRISGIRAARQSQLDLIPFLKKMVNDDDPQVRREVAIALRNHPSPEAPELWAALAQQHDGKDRWYLEALGIGAEGQWDRFYPAWANKITDNYVGKNDIIWRARTGSSIAELTELASNKEEPLENRLRYFRAFDFNPDKKNKSIALIKMLEEAHIQPESQGDSGKINTLVLTHLEPEYLKQSNIAQSALRKMLDTHQGTESYLEMVRKFEVREENPRLLEMALAESNSQIGKTAATLLLHQGGRKSIQEVLYGEQEGKVYNIINVFRGIGTHESLEILEKMVFDTSLPLPARKNATSAMGGSYG
ncbi:MAG: HEAT repeat domain-containing protein, partial [Cyclobacteriaceae bacterium]